MGDVAVDGGGQGRDVDPCDVHRDYVSVLHEGGHPDSSLASVVASPAWVIASLAWVVASLA